MYSKNERTKKNGLESPTRLPYFKSKIFVPLILFKKTFYIYSLCMWVEGTNERLFCTKQDAV